MVGESKGYRGDHGWHKMKVIKYDSPRLEESIIVNKRGWLRKNLFRFHMDSCSWSKLFEVEKWDKPSFDENSYLDAHIVSVVYFTRFY